MVFSGWVTIEVKNPAKIEATTIGYFIYFIKSSYFKDS
jgi:hypothetical protein